ncbi:MAG: efflux RND transporter periplasmic adaptor subunit [Rhodocyclaceae bacterium]
MTLTSLPTLLRRRPLIAVLTVLLIGAGAVTLVARPGRANTPATPRAVLTVVPVKPVERSWPVELAASGSIVAWQEALIGAETGGLRVAALHADVGDTVRRGQLLAELARDTVEADLRRYEAALASARASLVQARANASRAREVKDTGALSEQQINDYLATEATADASVKQAEAQVAAQKVTLAHTRIVAVDDGIITAKSALLGQVVSAGTELFRLQRQGRLEWQAEVNAKQLVRVQPGAKAEVQLPDGGQLTGKVRLVAPTLSTTTSRANVTVSLPAGATAGMFGNGRIEAGEAQVLAVPEAAVVQRDGLSYVFEIGTDNRVVRHRVTTGMRHDDLVQLRDGINADMKLVASGGGFLADGDLVEIAKEAP